MDSSNSEEEFVDIMNLHELDDKTDQYEIPIIENEHVDENEQSEYGESTTAENGHVPTIVYNAKDEFRCDACEGSFLQEKMLIQHVRSVHSESTCDVCLRAFGPNAATPAERLKTHSDSPLFCDACQKSFCTKKYLVLHARIHSGAKPFVCRTCRAPFRYKSTLMNHSSRCHGEAKPFACDVCPKAFSVKSYLTRHQMTHAENDSLPCACDVCHRRFPYVSSLNAHAAIHTERSPYACDVCSKTFALKKYFQAHLNRHANKKPFACRACPKAFGYKSSLVNHAGKSPYGCKFCGDAFACKGLLSDHTKSAHSIVTPTMCNVCRNSAVIRYARKNAEERPHACDFCHRSFKHMKSLYYHVGQHAQ